MDKITQSITLDLVEISHNVVNARQGDRLTRDLIITITNNGKDYEIPESSYVYIRGKRADGESVFYSATIEGTSIVHVNIHDFLLSYSGRCKLDIGIYNRVQSESGNDSDEIASTEPFILYVPEEIFNENDIVESDEGSTLSKLINSARDEIQEMNELEEEISNSENNRKVNEETRQTNEQTRQTNEQTRINSENIRNSNENTRKANEVIRESQESDRQTNTATAISNAEAATKKANDAADDLQAKLDSHHFVLTEDKGSANGVAELDENGIIISSQLPSYVDDVIEGYFYNSKFYKESTHTTEITGEAGKIYIDLSTEKTYRWSGSTFVVISETLALGETSSTAYRGDRGKIAYEHSQSAHAPSNAEENQNTFSSVIVGDDVISATSKTAALNLVAGTNVTITPDATNDRITISSDHPSISKSTDSTSTASPSAGETFTAVDSVTRDSNGHVTKVNTKTITLPNTAVVVDSELSSTSTNPVQNKIVYEALSDKASSDHAHNYAGSSSAGGSANSSIIPYGFSARSGSAPWGNQTGTYVTDWNDSTGGTIQFRRDNPTSGQLSAIIDGYFYQREGQYRCLDTSDSSSFAASSHTHSYAGSSSAGGSATSAVKLDSSAGSATQPVYFSGGKPVACTYSLGKKVTLYSGSKVLTNGVTISLSDDCSNYDEIHIFAYATVNSMENTRKFVLIDKFMSVDKGSTSRYISGGIYYNSSYNCCVGFDISSNGKTLTVREFQCIGYASVICGCVLGIKY